MGHRAKRIAKVEGLGIRDSGCGLRVTCYRPLVSIEADPTCYSLIVTCYWSLVARGGTSQEAGKVRSWEGEKLRNCGRVIMGMG